MIDADDFWFLGNEEFMSIFSFDGYEVDITKTEIIDVLKGDRVSMNIVNVFVIIAKYYNNMKMIHETKPEKN